MRPQRQPGRRPGANGTREQILVAARGAFSSQGFTATTIRGVADAAHVDPALIHHFFGTKDALFIEALELPTDLVEATHSLLEGGLDQVGERLVTIFLTVWDTTPGQGALLAMVRSAVSHETAAAMLREFLTEVILGPVARACGGKDPELRASLVAAQMIGLAMARYVVRIEPIASASQEVLIPTIGATVQRYLTGELS